MLTGLLFVNATRNLIDVGFILEIEMVMGNGNQPENH